MERKAKLGVVGGEKLFINVLESLKSIEIYL